MKIIKTKFKDAYIIEPQVFKDSRGFFLESYNKEKFAKAGIKAEFIQDNHSKSQKNVLRGLHFQKSPYAQAKLVRVTRGAVYDVIVDLRKDSSTYGEWEGLELSAQNFKMLFVPRGFAHGFCTLEDNTEFMYKVDNIYAPESEGGIIWNDKNLNIDWPVKKPIVSEKDKKLLNFKNIFL